MRSGLGRRVDLKVRCRRGCEVGVFGRIDFLNKIGYIEGSLQKRESGFFFSFFFNSRNSKVINYVTFLMLKTSFY